MQERGHVPLKLGGGSTPWVAVLDTHCHAAFQKNYEAAEQHDAAVQLRCGRTLPCTSRQTVLTRAVACWRDLNHARFSEVGWKADGFTLALDGSEDSCISRVCRPFWEELEMPQVREQLLLEVAEAVESGQIRSWWQYSELLEDYDAHEGLQEGLECNPEALLEEHEDAEAEDGAATPQNMSDEELPEESVAVPLQVDPVSEASAQIATENDGSHMEALLSMREQAKAVEDMATIRFLDQRIADVSKLQSRPSSGISVHLRQKAIERKQQEAAARCQQEAERQPLRALQQEERTAKMKLEAAKAEKSVAQASAQQKLEEARAAREALQAAAKQAAEEERLCRLHFAARLANHALYFAKWKPCQDELRKLETLLARACAEKQGEKTLPVPCFWERCRRGLS